MMFWKCALPLGTALLLTLTACNRSGGGAATGTTAEVDDISPGTYVFSVTAYNLRGVPAAGLV